jgi:hypothetical protein
MADLIFRKFRCVEETEEGGSDSPYFLIFVGRQSSSPTSSVTRVRRDAWDNEIDTGDIRVLNQKIAGGVDKNTLVLAALLEEDNDPDIAGFGTVVIQAWMQEAFKSYSASGSASVSELATKMKPEFKKAINSRLENDELVKVRWVELTTFAGSLSPLNFIGDGGHYKLYFDVA